MTQAICPSCGERKARRACPALGHQICAVCCGTKRLVEIRCPADCGYLASARDHPAAAVVRRQQRDVVLFSHFLLDLSQRQAELFLRIATALEEYEPAALQPLVDEDVSEAAAALAATYETASRGVLYEHRPGLLAAERLVQALKPVLAEAGQHLGATFERDAAVVLRRVAAAVGEAGAETPTDRRAFLDLIHRIVRTTEAPEEAAEAPRLIIP
jgi:hypothetical protein